jgi:flagellar motor switch protein FliN
MHEENNMTNTPWMDGADIERLMSRKPGPPSQFTTTPFASSEPSVSLPPPMAMEAQNDTPPPSDEPTLSPADAEELLRQAELAVQSMIAPPADASPVHVTPFQLEELQGAPVTTAAANLDLIRDVELNLKIELGRTQMSLDEVLKLRNGSVVALDRQAGDAVDVYANGKLIARGEVLVLDGNFCVRVVELTTSVNKAA